MSVSSSVSLSTLSSATSSDVEMEESLARQNGEVAVFKKEAAGLIDMVSEVSEKIMDFEKNKRNNLIFYGIPDDPKETPSILDAKVCEKQKSPSPRKLRCLRS